MCNLISHTYSFNVIIIKFCDLISNFIILSDGEIRIEPRFDVFLDR